ncbi:hypothetical protein FRB98_008415 [Tulasnella sp. 332]|nr:hypothetical protein FRB98_008415 [Tulasnella sp. 332]
MLATTAIRVIINVLFFDFDVDFTLLILYNVGAFIVFGVLALGLAYGFHPEATVYYATCVVYGIPEPISTTTVQLDHHLPAETTGRPTASAFQWNGATQAQPAQNVQLRADGAAPTRRLAPNVADFRHISSEDLPASRQFTAHYNQYPPLPKMTFTAPLDAAPRRQALVQERFSWQEQTKDVSPSRQIIAGLNFADLNPAYRSTPPQTLQEQQKAAFAELRSTMTRPIAVDGAGRSLQYDLAVESEYWNVVDVVTGVTVAIIDRDSCLGRGILILTTIHAQARIPPTDPIFTTLRAYAFEPLPRNHDTSYPRISPLMRIRYINICDLNHSHPSIIAQDTRLFKALKPFASSDFTTAAKSNPLARIPTISAPVTNSLPPIAQPLEYPTYLAVPPMVMPAPILTEVMITDVATTHPVDTYLTPTSAPVPANSSILDAAHVVAADTAMADVLSLTADSVTFNVTPVFNENAAPVAVDDAAMNDITTATIPTDSDAPPAVVSILATQITPFLHAGLTAHDKLRFQKITRAPDTSEQFDGPCTVSWSGPSGHTEKSSFMLELRRFIDADLFIPLNKSIYNFKTTDGAFVGSFISLETFPSFRNNDQLPTFPFRFLRVGSQDSREDVYITMTEAVAHEFCLMTGFTFPSTENVAPATTHVQAAPIPSEAPTISTTPTLVSAPVPSFPVASHPPPPVIATTTNSASASSTSSTSTQENPVTGKIYMSPCTIVRPIIKKRVSDTFYYRYMTTGSVGGWEFALTAKTKGVKRDWFPLLPDDCRWEPASDGVRRIVLAGIDVTSPGRTHRLRISEANAVRFCEWVGILQAVSSNEDAAGRSQPAASSSIVPNVQTPRASM